MQQADTSHSLLLPLTLALLRYYFTIFADICFYMNLPLMSVCRNVYCDGVYGDEGPHLGWSAHEGGHI